MVLLILVLLLTSMDRVHSCRIMKDWVLERMLMECAMRGLFFNVEVLDLVRTGKGGG